MRRRALLATTGTVALAGCTTTLPVPCASPSLRADRLEFETTAFPSMTGWWNGFQGAILATEPAHRERFQPPDPAATERDLELGSEARTFIDETEFDESLLLAVLVTTAAGSTDPRVTHVVREGGIVHCYVCVRRRGMDDVGNHQAFLVRTADRWDADRVRDVQGRRRRDRDVRERRHRRRRPRAVGRRGTLIAADRAET